MSELILKDESYKIIGACFEVYNQKGFGFTESVYQECLEIEFELQEIPFIAQPRVELDYKGRTLKQFFIPDFICFDKVIVELKALPCLVKENIAQTLNYLNATKFELAWLINFGQSNGLERKRIINDRNNSISLNIKLKVGIYDKIPIIETYFITFFFQFVLIREN